MFNSGKKLSASLISLGLISVIASCSSGNVLTATSVKGNSDFSNSNLSEVKFQQLVQASTAKGENVTVLDAGNGQKTGASFAMKISFGNGGFKTKASVGGTANKTFATDLKKFDVWLIETTGNIAVPSGDISGLITNAASNGRQFLGITSNNLSSQTITFKNVKENSAANQRYYVAIMAKDASAFNITKITAPATNGIASPTNHLYVTSTGGGTLLKSGSVFVDSTGSYGIVDTAPLGVTVTLADAVGATVESTVTVNDGAIADPIATTAS